MDMRHLNYLQAIANHDVTEIQRKERTYQGSWKKRGGIGAAMMLLRKIDRLEIMLKAEVYDIFSAINKDPSGQDGSALAEIRDLRRYLLLVEAEIQATSDMGLFSKPEEYRPGTHEDGGHHARQPMDDTDGDDYADRAEFKASLR
jgi:hypothetical protein